MAARYSSGEPIAGFASAQIIRDVPSDIGQTLPTHHCIQNAYTAGCSPEDVGIYSARQSAYTIMPYSDVAIALLGTVILITLGHRIYSIVESEPNLVEYRRLWVGVLTALFLGVSGLLSTYFLSYR